MLNFIACGTWDYKSPGTVDRLTDMIRLVVTIQYANVHKKFSA
jgi:hypothetical protein